MNREASKSSPQKPGGPLHVPEINVEITRHDVRLDPPATLFNVVLSNGTGSWNETLPERDLALFLRGAKAMHVMLMGPGSFEIPDVPNWSTGVFTEEKKLPPPEIPF